MTAVAIFVKTPGLSPVKSRLAADLGRERAIECHLRCAETIAAVAAQAAVGPVYWAVAEADGIRHPAWSGYPRLIQEGPGLGARMQAVHDELVRRHQSAVLIGADLPQLRGDDLARAAAHLGARDPQGVIGPARDGGFWLVGANHQLPRAVWQAPVYGGARVLQDFLDADRSRCPWFRLTERTDLDGAADLDQVIEEIRALEQPHELQLRLLQWLANLQSHPHPSSQRRP